MSRRKEQMKNFKLKKTIIYFAFSLLAIVMGFGILCVKCFYDNHKSFDYEVDGDKLGVQDPIYISLRDTKSWESLSREDGYVTGAQYDGVIVNNLNKNIRDWEMTIYLPQEGVIDSSWNGIYTEAGNSIRITPMDYNNLIEAGDEQSFGLVFYSERLLEFSRFSITGYFQVSLYQYKAFGIMVILAAFWVVSVVTYIVFRIKIHKLEKQRKKDRMIISQAMMIIAHLVDAKDEYTKEHSLRVALYSAEIARRSGMKEDDIMNLKYIALVHDCGKIGVPDAILKKNGLLLPEEREIINSHTVLGGHVMDSFNTISGIRDGALSHHERYDGTGYPNKLKGKKIPVCARIIGVADAYDAMSSDRCYRPRLPREAIVEELKKNSGTQFDPEYVGHMIAMMEDGTADRIREIKSEGADITAL